MSINISTHEDDEIPATRLSVEIPISSLEPPLAPRLPLGHFQAANAIVLPFWRL